MKQVVILAGGKGTRLRERLGTLPKPLVDVCGAPLLARQLALAERYGFTHALILVNHAARQIEDFVATLGLGMRIECVDDGRPRGTAGATLAALDRLAPEFLVMYGDTMLDVDLARFHGFHRQQAAAATLFLHPNDHPQDSDLVELGDDGAIAAFHPYPHAADRDYPNLVNAALYWMRRDALLPWRAEQRVLDFGKDLFPAMLARGLVLRGYRSAEYIKDIGTPQRLDRVCRDFRGGKIERASLSRPQAMVFLDRDGTLNREVDHLHRPDQMELLPGAAEAIRRLNASEYRCALITNQPVVARGECSVGDMRRIHDRLETLLGRKGAFLDRIYYCPHHPDTGFPGERPELKVDCPCRKPKPGMVDRAISEFNVARERSWFIGDSSVDMETARRAALRSILVETGYAGLDYRWWAAPDFIVPDISAAVSFILDEYPRIFDYCTKLAAGIGAGAIVLIGGQSRSGKSTFASVLRDALRARGQAARVLSTDRWLKNRAERDERVTGRFDVRALQELLDALADPMRRPAELTLPGYHKLKRARFDAVDTIEIASSDVVVLEGCVALALESRNASEVHRFHLEIEEGERKRRVVNEYRLRGMGEAQALETYLSRRIDEFPEIEALAGASRRVSLAHLERAVAETRPT
jgi:histidinol-phosphate phosphatase family protein